MFVAINYALNEIFPVFSSDFNSICSINGSYRDPPSVTATVYFNGLENITEHGLGTKIR
jgi:hypothetical protein